MQTNLSRQLLTFFHKSPMTYEWAQLVIGALVGLATYFLITSKIIINLFYTGSNNLQADPSGLVISCLLTGFVSAQILIGTEERLGKIIRDKVESMMKSDENHYESQEALKADQERTGTGLPRT
jgi:hypothetical protein